IYKWIERKEMPCHKAGRLWKFLASEIDLWVKSGHAAKDIAPRKPVLARKRKVNRACTAHDFYHIVALPCASEFERIGHLGLGPAADAKEFFDHAVEAGVNGFVEKT